MAIGGLVLAFVAGPWGQEQAWTNLNGKEIYAVSAPGKAWRELGLWLGAPILVASGVLSFLFQWRSILRAFSSFGGGAKAAADEDPRVAATEVPTSWFGVGSGGATAVCRRRLPSRPPPSSYWLPRSDRAGRL